jgi:hypothetical protein
LLHPEKCYNNHTLFFVKGTDALPVETTKKKPKKPGRWGLRDLIFGLFGLAAIGAITLAAFLTVKWAIARYAHLLPWGH